MDENKSQLPHPRLIKSSQEIKEITEALCQAQGEFPVIPKDSQVDVYSRENKFLYSYKYADLTTIISSVRPSLTKFGLSFTQSYCKDLDLGFGWETTIFHKSGQWLKSGFVPGKIPDNMDMKSVAGQATYGKRISLTAALGVSADEDMDAPQTKGEGMQKPKGPDRPPAQPEKPKDPPKQQATPPAKPKNHAPGASNPPDKPLSDAQIKRLYAIGGATSWPSESIRILCVRKVGKTPGDLNKTEYDELCDFLGHSPFDETQAQEMDKIKDSLTDKEKAMLAPPAPAAPKKPMDELLELVDQKSLIAEMPDIIKKATGKECKAKDLTSDELLTVIQFIKKFKK